MQNIFLIGPMGSGKTTIGRQLAVQIGCDFYDSDREIEKRTGVDIDLIFEIEGEEGFRLRESKIIEELAQLKDSIIATGGGSILSEDNRKCIQRNGRVVYLKSSLEKLYERTGRSKKRPLLNTDDRMTILMELMETRGPLYEEMADLIISTDNQPIKKIIDKISQQLDVE